MLSEEKDNSSRDCDSSSDSSSGSPPHKRPRRPLLFTNQDFEKIRLKDLKKIDAEEILPKVYVDWFMSLGANENDILLPEYYDEWFMTLGTEAQADVLYPGIYIQWYMRKFYKVEPLTFPSLADLIRKYGQPALEYFNKINKCDYEYVRDVALNECGLSYHLNFYGRLKVSSSRPESEAPEILFFADGVLECCILDSHEFGDATVLHPPHFRCSDHCAPIY
ncbi:uncharacterized protein LOC141622613 [Silene latifolia]|uniref:uncharacterized protein LOC141622613 n=1 Tax=Silene latifolia TaxID=37657 RepID=UPI003D789807